MELHRDTILCGLVTHVYSWPSVGKMTRLVLWEFCRKILSHEQRFRSSKRYLRYRNKISYVRSKQAKFSRERQIFLHILDPASFRVFSVNKYEDISEWNGFSTLDAHLSYPGI